MTDLFTHWIDVVQWAMQSDQPTQAYMLGDKYVFEQWDCPDTIQAAFRYQTPENKGFDVVYEGNMSSSIDDGGIDFRGADATLKLTRSGFSVYRENLPGKQNPVLTESATGDGTITHMQNFFECVKTREQPVSDVYTHHRAITTCHLANISMRLGRSITWNPETQQIVGDKEAQKWQSREQRKGYEINA